MVESAGKIFGWLIIITKLPNYQSWLIIITKLPNFLSIVWHTVFHFLYWNTVHCKMWQVWEGGDGEKNSFPRLTCFISFSSAPFWCWGQEVFCSLSLSPASDLRCLAYVDIVGWSYHSLQRQTTIGMKAPMATKMGRNELVSSSE